jgi:hypothetical protein
MGWPPWSVTAPTNLFFPQRLVLPHGFWNAQQLKHPVWGNAQQRALGRKVNAYRCEVQGCHAGLLGLLAFAIYHQIQGVGMDFYFDNDAGLNHLSVSMKLKHGDLIQAIHWIMYKLYNKHLILV